MAIKVFTTWVAELSEGYELRYDDLHNVIEIWEDSYNRFTINPEDVGDWASAFQELKEYIEAQKKKSSS